MSDPAPIASFQDRLPGSVRRFVLYPDRLVVSGRLRWSGIFEFPYVLGGIDPAYGIIRSRSAIAGPGALILGTMFGFLFVFGLFNGRPEFFPSGAVAAGTLATLCIAAGIRNARHIERYVFRSTSGVTSFDIARSGPDREQFDGFVQQVVAAIKANHSAPH